MPAQVTALPTAAPSSAKTRSAWPGIRRWSVAVTVYLMAVFNRTSIGVAGLAAARRFGISPAQLSVFILLQLGVYAAMQVPTGIMLDRFGPRRMLVVASSTMALAQLAFAIAPSYPAALLARAILGCGDAMTYISVLRVGSSHFTPRRFPHVIAATGLLGTAGNLAATLPLVLLLRDVGWAPTFAAAGAVTLMTGVAVWFMLPPGRPAPRAAALAAVPSPPGRRPHHLPHHLLDTAGRAGQSARRLAGQARSAWRTPGTRLGFWLHFSGMAFTGMFGFLWGMPYLTAVGFRAAAASEVLLAGVVVSMAAGPAIGVLISRHPASRVPFAVTVSALGVAGWVLLLAGFPGQPPHAAIAAVVAVTAIGGPTSSIGFALARDYNPAALVGTASGVVNVAGFSAAIAATLVVGWVLSASGHANDAAFRTGFAIAIAIQALGTLQTVRWWLRVRAHQLRAQARGEEVPVPLTRRPFDLVRAWES